MRTVTFGVASSLDNFIARADHSVDWLHWSDDVAAITNEIWPTFDTVIMGRKTYEVAVANGVSAYPNVRNYVFSRTIPADPNQDVTFVCDDAATVVDRLKREPGKGICVMGGGELANSLFAAGLIDEVGLNIHPIILGDGIPCFHQLPQAIELDLVETRRLHGDCMLVRYKVRR